MRTLRSMAAAGTALVLAAASLSAQPNYRGQQQSDDLCQIVINGNPSGRPMRCDVARASAPRNARIIYAGANVSNSRDRDWRYAAEQQRVAERVQRERLEREREVARIEREREVARIERQRAIEREERLRRERLERDRYRHASYDRR